MTLPPERLAVGALFHQKYRVLGVLGAGGCGVVYDAMDEFVQESVALKLVSREGERGRDFAERARREVKLLRGLRHPGLVEVREAGLSADGDFVYIAMERLVGVTLRSVLSGVGPLSVAEAFGIGAEIADALAVVHQAKAVHRDLKPENVMIEPVNRVKVLDFGIAKFTNHIYKTTAKYRAPGTLLYASPEQLFEEYDLDGRSDIYSLGILLFEAIAGRHYLLDGARLHNARQLQSRQITERPPLLSDEIPGLPRDAAKVVARMLEKRRDDRFRDMTKVAAALRQAREALPPQSKLREVRDLVTMTRASRRSPQPPLVSRRGGTLRLDGVGNGARQQRTLRLDAMPGPSESGAGATSIDDLAGDLTPIIPNTTQGAITRTRHRTARTEVSAGSGLRERRSWLPIAGLGGLFLLAGVGSWGGLALSRSKFIVSATPSAPASASPPSTPAATPLSASPPSTLGAKPLSASPPSAATTTPAAATPASGRASATPVITSATVPLAKASAPQPVPAPARWTPPMPPATRRRSADESALWPQLAEPSPSRRATAPRERKAP